jgi:hypothetical protein
MSIFNKVTRHKAKARIALMGVTGAGKTLGALYIAFGLTNDWGKVALIDTERERARFYADRSDLGTGQFLYASLSAPYSAERYREYITAAAEAVGPDGCVIIDSFSHAWNNEGGILEKKEQIAKEYGKTSYSAWNEAGKIQNRLVNSILSTNCHTIVTMRSKMEYTMLENERGKLEPCKVGLAPVQRDDVEYEFDIIFDIDRSHKAQITKSTLFLEKYDQAITPALGVSLRKWLDSSNSTEEPERLFPPEEPAVRDTSCCEVCGQVISQKRLPSGAVLTAEEIILRSKQSFGKVTCIYCSRKLRDAKNANNPANPTVSA